MIELCKRRQESTFVAMVRSAILRNAVAFNLWILQSGRRDGWHKWKFQKPNMDIKQMKWQGYKTEHQA